MDSLTEYLEDLIESSGNKEWDIEYSVSHLVHSVASISFRFGWRRLRVTHSRTDPTVSTILTRRKCARAGWSVDFEDWRQFVCDK